MLNTGMIRSDLQLRQNTLETVWNEATWPSRNGELGSYNINRYEIAEFLELRSAQVF